MIDYFISHAKEDREFADKLYEKLVNQGKRVWYAPKSLTLGEDWVQAIVEGIKSAEVVIVLLSKSSLKSNDVEFRTY